MAISSDQPISAANLKAVVEKLMVGGYLPEVLAIHNKGESLSNSYSIKKIITDRFKRLELYVEYSSRVHQVIIPNSAGKYHISDEYPDMYIEVKVYNGSDLNIDSNYVMDVYKIIGLPF